MSGALLDARYVRLADNGPNFWVHGGVYAGARTRGKKSPGPRKQPTGALAPHKAKKEKWSPPGGCLARYAYKTQFFTRLEISLADASSSSPAPALRAMSARKFWASWTETNSGTGIASSTKRKAWSVPRLEYLYGIKKFAHWARSSAGLFGSVTIDERCSAGSMSPRASSLPQIASVRLFRLPTGRPFGLFV